LNPPGAEICVGLYVCPPPVGAPIGADVSQVTSLTTITSPLAGVNDGVVSVELSWPGE